MGLERDEASLTGGEPIRDRAAAVAKLKAAGEKLDALHRFSESKVDGMVEEFKQLRRTRRGGGEPSAVRK